MYKELGQESKMQKEEVAELKQADKDMTPEDMDEDAW